MTFSSKFNLLLALVVGYLVTCVTTGGALLPLYQIFNNKELWLTMTVVFLLATIVLYSLEQYKEQRSRIRAAMTLRRAPKLKAHMQTGLRGGSFAYLAEQQPYGAPGEDMAWLPAMAIVYIIDQDEQGQCVVVPYFSDLQLQRPMLAIKVPQDKLYKHVPRHMIPELI